MSNIKSGAVIHREVAVIACDNAGTLKETLVRLSGLDIDAVCLGERHLVLPAAQIGEVLNCLKGHGQVPRLVGDESLVPSLASDADNTPNTADARDENQQEEEA